MTSIVLTTLNARYSHASLALRYLQANLKEYENDSTIVEFTIKSNPADVVERLLAQSPRVIGFGVYIWNVHQTTQVIEHIRQVAPDIRLVAGGPEVSHDLDGLELVNHVDHIVQGEGESSFYRICQESFNGKAAQKSEMRGALPVLSATQEPPDRLDASGPRVWRSELPELTELHLPYAKYTDDDIAHRNIYVEASRGCPFRCQFCLSSLDKQVRQFPLEDLFDAFQALIDRGARTFRFIDRTFNLKPSVSEKILRFFLEQSATDFFLHFEMVPDRFPSELRDLILQFPPGAVQFEIGIQTTNAKVAALIDRRMDLAATQQNLAFLTQQTNVHIHADLIVGLPGEDRSSFFQGFDWLYGQRPHEIQVGVLKKLRGAPIARHEDTFEMVFSESAPYEIMSTKDIDSNEMIALKRFARYWDLYGNSGRFTKGLALVLQGAESPAAVFARFSEFSYERMRTLHGLSLLDLVENIFVFAVENLGVKADVVQGALAEDYTKDSPRPLPGFLKGAKVNVDRRSYETLGGQQRQSRHRA